MPCLALIDADLSRFVPCKVFQPTPLYKCINCVKIRCTRKSATLINTWKLQPSTNITNMWPGLILAVVGLGNGFKSISKHFVVNHLTATSSLKDHLQFIYQWKGFYITGNLPQPDSSQELIERCCRKSPRIQRWHGFTVQSWLSQESSILRRRHYFALCVTHTGKINRRPSVKKLRLNFKWTLNLIRPVRRNGKELNEKIEGVSLKNYEKHKRSSILYLFPSTALVDEWMMAKYLFEGSFILT